MSRYCLALLVICSGAFGVQFGDAVKRHAFRQAGLLLQRGEYVDERDGRGWTALILAARDDDTAACRFLIENGADPEGRDDAGGTPLSIACDAGSVAASKLLVGLGADINSRTKEGVTPVMRALRMKNLDLVKFLVESGADLSLGYRDSQREGRSFFTPLFYAAEVSGLEVFEYIFERNPALNAALPDKRTLLMAAAQGGNVKVAMKLIELGADVTAIGGDGSTALSLACRKGAPVSLVERLLERGADPKGPHHNGMSPLLYASFGCGPDVIRVLLKHGAKAEAADRDGRTPLYTALSDGNIDNAKVLLDHGAKHDIVAKNGHSLVAVALVKGDSAVFRTLINRGIGLNVKYPDPNVHPLNPVRYCTVLTQAAGRGWPDIVKLAVEKGADPGLRNGDGMTAVEAARSRDKWNVFQVLVETGAWMDKSKLDSYLSWACTRKNTPGTVASLIKKGANPDSRAKGGKTHLMVACENGFPAQVKSLLAARADPTLRDVNGNSALHIAVESGCAPCVEALMTGRTDPQAKNRDGYTAVDVAVYNRDTAMLSVLLDHGAHGAISDSLYDMIFGRDGSLELARIALKRFCNINKGLALIRAAHCGRFEIATLLLENGADPNYADDNGATPIMHSCNPSGDSRIPDLLLKHGADPEIVDHDGHGMEWHRRNAKSYSDEGE